MKTLLISPIVYAYNPATRYAGLEKLVWQFDCEIAKEHEVSVMCHSDSVFPTNVQRLPMRPEDNAFSLAELRHYQAYQYRLREFDVIHDFSHSHLASRYNVNLPTVNPVWHSPFLNKYPKAPYNIIAPSEWARRAFRQVYNQQAKYMPCIVIDTDVYKPDGERGDRFLTLGIMTPDKGNLASAMLCKELGLPLDIVGGRGNDNKELTEYEKAIQAISDGKQIKFWGEVSDDTKIGLLQSCKALIYTMGAGYQEVTSHKVQEALLCGAPVITSLVGAMPEIITHGVDGYLCANENEYKQAMVNVYKLDPSKTRDKLVAEYSIKDVVAKYGKLYQEVKDGLRW